MKILILTTYSHKITEKDPDYIKESSWRIFTYLRKNHNVEITRYNELSIKISNEKTEIYYNEKPLSYYDFIIFRSTTYNGTDLEWITQIVADYTIKNKIPSINALHYSFFGGNWNKLRQMSIFANAGIPVPITNFTNQEELISYPNVAKPRLGSHGKGIYVVNSKEEFPRNPENYLFQEVLPNNSDYRIIVLKNKVIGTISRKAINGNFVSNVSAGGIAKNFETTNKMKKLAIKLAKICKLDFCGIDLMKDSDGELKVLEVNRNLEFNGFEKASNILIPTIIEKFILNSK